MITKPTLVLGALSAVLALGLVWALKRPPQGPVSDVELRQEVAQLRSELRADQRAQGAAIARLAGEERAQVSKSFVSPNALPAPAPASAAAAVQNRVGTPSEQIFAAEQRSEELATQLEGQFALQRADDGFSTRAAAAMRSILAPVPGSRLVSAECRQQLCKVVVDSDSADAQRALATQIAGKEPFDQDIFYRYDQESTPRKTTLYVARAGTDLVSLVPAR